MPAANTLEELGSGRRAGLTARRRIQPLDDRRRERARTDGRRCVEVGRARTGGESLRNGALDPPRGRQRRLAEALDLEHHVDEVVYLHPVGLVDLRVRELRRPGWTRLPTLIGQRYTGRVYTG